MRKARTLRAPAGARWVLPLRMRELAGSRKSAIGEPWQSVGARLRRNGLRLVGERVEMHRPVVEARAPGSFDPDQRMLEPALVVALREVLAGVGAAALGPVGGGLDGRRRLQEQVFQLHRLHEIGVPDERAVADPDVREGLEGLGELARALLQRLPG